MSRLTIFPENRLNIKHNRVLDAYFAERISKPEYETVKETYTVKAGDYLSKIAKKKKTTVAKLKKDNNLTSNAIKVGDALIVENQKEKGTKVNFKRLNSAHLGDEVYVLVKTDNLHNYTVAINVKQGKTETPELHGNNSSLLLQHDEGESTLAKVKIGAYAHDNSITNKDDFIDWAIFKITLGSKDNKKEQEALEKLPDKKAFLFLLVDAHSPNNIKVAYNGTNPDKNGELDQRSTPNYWLDMDGNWFELKKNDCCKSNLSKEQIKRIATNATNANINEHLNGINESFKDNEINTCLRKIHYLAQLIHESGSFKYTEEIGASETDYGGFKGRGLIQLTYKSNYKAYGQFVDEDVTSTQKNKEKLEDDPHAAKSAGWFWAQKAKLNDEADNNDFIFITRLINGGFNGYNDRLKYVKKGFKELYTSCSNKKEKDTDYEFNKSAAYNDKRASFAWGLWHDPDLSKSGCTKDKVKSLEGYERFVELTNANYSKKNWYGIKSISEFLSIKETEGKGKNKKTYVKVRDAAELRIKQLKDEK
ncbi:hypothetical protein TMP227_180060 [Tenacibaculum maritimum]|uniref:LysM peptidoglycan-binding domain-containing protein n=2 Tax=Tenacibaculum maritimum TaxID=107401 RepID=UPI0012E4E76F|nr:LysM peptidoglycan-binding domain-containing protein [Tenacibaculum maritimum]CAA0174426.1 hypothetical protein TMP227_180060 [Tenacibaculum maritimum]